MKPPIHREGDDVIICAKQMESRQLKQPDIVAAIKKEGTRLITGDYLLPHKRMLQLLRSPSAEPKEWPKAFLPLKLLAKPEDQGLGDIVARTIGPIGGDVFKEWYLQTFGKSCGCSTRQKRWNELYPL